MIAGTWWIYLVMGQSKISSRYLFRYYHASYNIFYHIENLLTIVEVMSWLAYMVLKAGLNNMNGYFQFYDVCDWLKNQMVEGAMLLTKNKHGKGVKTIS